MMDKCIYGNNPSDCQYFYSCGAEPPVTEIELAERETRTFDLCGPALLLFHEGGACACHIGGTSYDVSSEPLLILPHHQFAIETRTARRITLFHPDTLRWLARGMGIDMETPLTGKRIKPAPVPLFGNRTVGENFLLGLSGESPKCAHYAEIKIKELAWLIHAHSADATKDKIRCTLSSGNWLFRLKALGFVFSGKSLDECGAAVGLTVSGFSKRFKRVFGTSYYQTCLAHRFECIEKDLIYTDIPFKELARRYNFCSVQHFGSFVIRHGGMSPGRLRKTLRAETGRS
ncbi:MAG: AraC family transcriptional regulator [Alistipes sp.]|nr:AraC family transcriptional regulator [Alistipes sp.]